MRVLIATTNQDKLREIRSLLDGVDVELLTLRDLPAIAEPEETGQTFQDNARLKARYYAAASGLMTIAEDSGLVIDALGGDPGVRSARFLRPNASYAERFTVILRRMAEHPERGRAARFLCAATVVDDDRVLFETVGRIEGEIADAPRGHNGFGYDPIFLYPPYGTTLAEVSEAAKLAVAHRGEAFRAVAAWLQQRTSAPK
jgi:XTP/dITP diphosphohydrolase